MAKRKAARRAKSARPARKAPAARRSAKRPSAKRPAKRQASAKKKAPAKKASKRPSARVVVTKKPVNRPKARLAAKKTRTSADPVTLPRLDRSWKEPDARETHDTPPSSLDMDRHGSAARTGRAEIAQSIREHHGMDDVTGGDLDVGIEDAYFAGEEAPGGDNPTPDQDIVEDIGKALGVTYNDNEELEGSDKVVRRDKHRWELDPASSDDYKDRS